jgi:hypothetical protein
MTDDHMTDWQPIETAPRDGTCFQARIPGEGDHFIIALCEGFEEVDGSGNIIESATWVIMADQEPPASWTDGICWSSNADDEPSVQPTHWTPLKSSRPIDDEK